LIAALAAEALTLAHVVPALFFATARLTHLEPRQFFGIAFCISFAATYLAGEGYLQRHPAGLDIAA